MSIKRILFVATICVAWVFFGSMSCNSTKPVPAPPEPEPKPEPTITCEEALKNDPAMFGSDSDRFIFNSASIQGDCLEIHAGYSGGCGEAKFTLVWSGVVKKRR